MDTEKAIQDVHEIKQMMRESRQKSNHARGWVGLALILTSIAICVIFPIITPCAGIGLLAGGIIFYRHTDDSQEKAVAITAIIIGSLMILASIILFILGFALFEAVSTTSDAISIEQVITD